MVKGLRSLGLVGLLAVVGCADPVIGRWECDQDDVCGDIEFEIKDDLTGDGDGTFNDGVNTFNCNFDVDATNTGDSNYDMEVTFTGSCSGADKVDDNCRLSDGILDCDDFGEYRKQD